MNLKWTTKELIEIENSLFENGSPLCPNDSTLLNTDKIQTLGGYNGFYARCRRCGRTHAGTIDKEEPMSEFDTKYEVIAPINSGGMGTVNIVRERATGSRFAAKTILPEFLRNAEMVRRFKRESRIQKPLSHPHVMPVIDSFLDENGCVIVMPIMAGGDLGGKIRSKTATLSELATIFEQVAEGVSYCHSQGIIHRDLKPENVLIGADGVAKVSDFGLAMFGIRDSTVLTVLVRLPPTLPAV